MYSGLERMCRNESRSIQGQISSREKEGETLVQGSAGCIEQNWPKFERIYLLPDQEQGIGLFFCRCLVFLLFCFVLFFFVFFLFCFVSFLFVLLGSFHLLSLILFCFVFFLKRRFLFFFFLFCFLFVLFPVPSDRAYEKTSYYLYQLLYSLSPLLLGVAHLLYARNMRKSLICVICRKDTRNKSRHALFSLRR